MCSDRLLLRVGRLVLACLVGMLAGCALAKPTPEPVTITFAFPEVDAAHYEELVTQFAESHRLIAVELRPKTWRQLYGPQAEIADVSLVSTDLAGRLSEEDRIMDLGPLIEQYGWSDLADFFPGVVDAVSHEGQTWAMPYGADPMVMYYNRDLFDEYNVSFPQAGWTWDDFLERAVALRDPDTFVFGYGPRPGPPYDAVLFIYQHGGRIFDDLEHPTRATFTDRLTLEALDWYARLIHDYDAAPSLNQASTYFGGGSYAVYQGIRTDKVGMWMGSLSERGGLSWPFEWPMRWGMVPLPSDAHAHTEAGVEGYVVASEATHYDACWEWIAWVSEQVPYRLVPARRSLAESSAYEERVGADVAAVARASMQHALVFDTVALGQFAGAMEALGDALEAIVQGHQTPQEAMDEAQRKAGP